jgi:predicted DNA-binding transcriptional regulator YafY
MFTNDEALVLSLGLVAAHGIGLTTGTPAVASARAKLERVMRTKIRQRVRAVPLCDSQTNRAACRADMPRQSAIRVAQCLTALHLLR